MRRRGGLNKIGMLAIALIIALGAVGVTYSAWVDEIYIDGTISTSDTVDGLGCGSCSPDSGDSYITCATSADEMELTISIINPLEGADYYCNFTFSNEADSWPVEITSMTLSNPYSDSGVSVAFDNLYGMVINPGTTASGQVHIHLADTAELEETLIFTLAVTVE
jgi:hypothetical protein